jgi:SAM-dependent methyltransferase
MHNQRIVAQFTRWAKPFAELPIHAQAGAMARCLAACALEPTLNVLDVACGPGILACAMAPHARHVTGIDITPAMIAQAQVRHTAAGRRNLAWHIGDAGALPFAAQNFDRVTTRYSLHHMQDPAAVLREMKRVCRPGGRIIVIDATPSPDTRDGYDTMERLRDPSHTSALPLDELRRMGKDAGLTEATLCDERDITALTAIFDADIATGQDRIGVGAWRTPEGIRFHFPVSIVSWHNA